MNTIAAGVLRRMAGTNPSSLAVSVHLRRASGPGGDQVSFQKYADEFSKRGRQSPSSWLDYKNHEYLNWNKWSYYDLEAELTQHRLPQPNPKVAEKPRDTIPPTVQEKK